MAMDLRQCTLQLLQNYEQIALNYGMPLRRPLVEIRADVKFYGRWDPLLRRIEISESLIHQQPWDVVINVLKHEMAHQIVSEVYKDEAESHGALFRRACEAIGLDVRYQGASTDLGEVATDWREALAQEQSPLLQKVEKLFSLAQSTNENEASLAMARAQELLKKNHLEVLHRPGAPTYVYSVLVTDQKKISALQNRICSILMTHYFVDVVLNETYRADHNDTVRTIELFGTPTNVLIAEYVYYFLKNTLTTLWRDYQKRERVSGKFRRSFELGVLLGFDKKLAEMNRREPTSSTVADEKCLALSQKDLARYVGQRHPRLRKSRGSSQRYHAEYYDAGFKQGRELVLHKGLAYRGRGRKLLGTSE